MQNAEKITADFLKQKNLLPLGKKILLAISGGADSVALLYIFHKLYPNTIHIAHINHQLRGSAALKDEEYVKSLADKLKLHATIESVNVSSYAKENKLSIETAARTLRLAALGRIADKFNCSFIATAHHKNDNAETVIHRILRGTGFKGLAGIRPKTIISGKTFIRPLLNLTRRDIEEYLENKNISWQTDHTNLDCRFTRNRIRHKILPLLEKGSPDIVELVSSLSRHCAVLANNIEKRSDIAQQTCVISKDKTQIIFDLAKYLKQPQPVQVELIQLALAYLNCGLQKFTSEHYNKIIHFAKSSGSGKTLTVPGKIKITKGNDKLFITAGPQKPDAAQKEIVLSVPGKTLFADWKIETKILTADKLDIENIRKKKDNLVEWFDFELIKPPLIVRLRRTGDKFKPFGHTASKRIGKFLTSAKIDPDSRKKVFLLCDYEKVLWLVPIRRSSGAIVDIHSRKILKIDIIYDLRRIIRKPE